MSRSICLMILVATFMISASASAARDCQSLFEAPASSSEFSWTQLNETQKAVSEILKTSGVDVDKVKTTFGYSLIGRHYRTQKGTNELIYITGLVVRGFRKLGYDNATLQAKMLLLEIGPDIHRTRERLQTNAASPAPARTNADIQKAHDVLERTNLWPSGRPFTAQQVSQIEQAHNHALGKPGKDGRPAAIGNYTVQQNATKLRILMRGQAFTFAQAVALADAEVVGYPPLRARPLYMYDAEDLGVSDVYEGKSFRELIAIGAPHEFIFKAYRQEKQALETSLRTGGEGDPDFHLQALIERWTEYNAATIYGTLRVQRTVPAAGVHSQPPGPGMILNPHGYWMPARPETP